MVLFLNGRFLTFLFVALFIVQRLRELYWVGMKLTNSFYFRATTLMQEELAGLDVTMERIKAFTKLALVSNPEEVFAQWNAELKDRLQKPKPNLLPLLYACNDVLQESAKLTAVNQAYTRLFSPTGALKDILITVIKARPDLTKNVQKIIGIWKDRRVFPAADLNTLNKHVFSRRKSSKQDSDEEDSAGSGPDSSAEDVEVVYAKNNEEHGNQEEEEEEAEDARELQIKRLKQMSNAQLFAMLHGLDSELKKPFRMEDSAGLERVCNEVSPQTTSQRDVEYAMEDVKRKIAQLKARRFALQAHGPVKLALKSSLEKSIQQVEEGMHHAGIMLEQTRVVKQVLQDVLQGEGDNRVMEAKYKSVKLIPKREKVVQPVTSSGPGLMYEEETLTGVTAEDAAKSTRPMMWHRGLQKYVPLPSGNDSDNWRN